MCKERNTSIQGRSHISRAKRIESTMERHVPRHLYEQKVRRIRVKRRTHHDCGSYYRCVDSTTNIQSVLRDNVKFFREELGSRSI